WVRDNREEIVGFIQTTGKFLYIFIIKPLEAILWLLEKIMAFLNYAAQGVADLMKQMIESRPSTKFMEGFVGRLGIAPPEGDEAADLPKGGKGGGADKARQEQLRLLEAQSKEILRVYTNETER